jgi:hypothetical protein
MYNGVIKKQCEMLLEINKVKINTFLEERLKETQANREKNAELMGQTFQFKRISSLECTLLTAPPLSTSRTF